MASILPKIHALDKPAIPDTFGIANSPIGFFLAAWQDELLIRLTLLPAHVEKDIIRVMMDYHLPSSAKQDDARAKKLVMTHLFAKNDWQVKLSADLALGFHGTAFQHKAMKEMLKIPAGKTLSYGQLGAKTGAPNAARAIGTICAGNPLCFIIPCHRIVAASGLGGYGHGTALKRQLLQWENAL